MIASEIMLPPHAPEIYLDRATLWNAVESCEKHPKAQLAYSFDIAMQNELTLEENMELARKFVQEQFVAKGMIADLAFHSPEKEDGGIPNPHFHVMTTMRPLNPDGTWGQKQRREYLLDEDGNRIRDKNGDYVFNAVHTTDWHEPETLERWREAWSVLCNGKFEEEPFFVWKHKNDDANFSARIKKAVFSPDNCKKRYIFGRDHFINLKRLKTDS